MGNEYKEVTNNSVESGIDNLNTTTFGSATLSRPLQIRALKLYLFICIVAMLPCVFGLSSGWQAAGFGLAFPGAGFLLTDSWPWLFFLITVVLMLFAYLLFQLMANLLAPIVVWLGSLLLSVALAPEQMPSGVWVSVLTVIVSLALLFFFIGRTTLKKERERLEQRRRYLPQAIQSLQSNAVPAGKPGERELSAEDLMHLRYALDRGLQPVESFDGFDVIEQFQTSSLRYQLNYLLWGLQLAQCHYTPNFHGYLNDAQRNLIDKFCVPKVWKWWRWENLLGNFNFNFDPIARDNIMLGGFASINIALYTANTGDDHYLEPGSLTFVEDDWQKFEHSLQSILAAGRMNNDKATYAPLYPCEPGLTYSACNVWGNIAHLTADRILGGDYGQKLVERLRAAHISEMLGVDGSPHAGRINLLGVRMPVYTSNFVSAQWAWMGTPFFADLSMRAWAVLRHETTRFDNEGEIDVDTQAYDRVDIGNYSSGSAALLAHYLVLAQEFGDQQVAEAILRKLDREYGKTDNNGTYAYAKASNMTNAVALLARLVRCEDIRNMVLQGPGQSVLAGPVLEGVKYPDVLVAKAYSHYGNDLALVVYPGKEPSHQALSITRLQAVQAYQIAINNVEPRTILADGNGELIIDVEIEGRTEIMITPVGD